jgi:LAO/AO transport system kinase
LSTADYISGIRAGDRTVLSRAITLIESANPAHSAQAQEVLGGVLDTTGGAHRVGITGVPGVGKSTFIEAMGNRLIERGHRVAVLAIDPSSSVTGGSILGDKTRMETLSAQPEAFIRPSPAGSSLGGVARKTRETMLLCEAAGFDVVLIETVGVGQSETVVHDMVDFFLVLMLAGAGDELQGIKRGVLEMADLIAVNKADGDNAVKAKRARRDYANALAVMTPSDATWQPPALTCSGLSGSGLNELWDTVINHHQLMTGNGALTARRSNQQVRWMWSLIEERLLRSFRHHGVVGEQLAAVEQAVHAGTRPPTAAATDLLATFGID